MPAITCSPPWSPRQSGWASPPGDTPAQLSTGFDLRLRSQFTVEQLRSRTEEVLATALPGLRPVTLEIVELVRDFVRHGPAAPRVPEAFLHHSYGESGELGPSFVLITPDAVAGVEIIAVDIGFSEDPESGRSLCVDTSVDRTPVSILLGIAAAIASSQLTKSPIWDDSLELTGHRVVEPDEVLDRLGTPAHGARHLRDIAIPVLRGLSWSSSPRARTTVRISSGRAPRTSARSGSAGAGRPLS